MQRALLASKQDVVVGMSSSHVLPKCHYDDLLSHRIEVYLHGSELQEQKHQACLRQTVNKCRRRQLPFSPPVASHASVRVTWCTLVSTDFATHLQMKHLSTFLSIASELVFPPGIGRPANSPSTHLATPSVCRRLQYPRYSVSSQQLRLLPGADCPATISLLNHHLHSFCIWHRIAMPDTLPVYAAAGELPIGHFVGGQRVRLLPRGRLARHQPHLCLQRPRQLYQRADEQHPAASLQLPAGSQHQRGQCHLHSGCCWDGCSERGHPRHGAGGWNRCV